MVIHHPTKIDEHRHLGGRHVMSLAVGVQDSTSLPKSVLSFSESHGRKHITCHVQQV